MIITRDIINKNIKFHDVEYDTGEEFVYDFNYLFTAIDLYKNFLLDAGVKPQETVTIAENISIWQIAAIFACCELGLKIVITDFIKLSTLSYKTNKIDSKTKVLMPIDYFLPGNTKSFLDKPETCGENDWKIKAYYCDRISNKTLFRDFIKTDLKNISENKTIFASKDHVLTKTTTSGTTGTPKLIEHTHRFLFDLLHRNSKWFSGNYIVTSNLNHGSSMFCYAVPALVSENVTDYYNFTQSTGEDYSKIVKTISNYSGKTNIMLPYSSVTEQFLQETASSPLPDTTIHVLGNIKSEWVDKFYKKKYIENIVSNFGSNETTGPIFINECVGNNFSEIKYKKFDNYFQTKIENSGLEVYIPIYDKWVATGDKFIDNGDGTYSHNGRIDLVRINDFEVDEKRYQALLEEYFIADFIYDQVKSEIYLAVWEPGPNFEDNFLAINSELDRLSMGLHTISKYDILNYNDFLTGIKIDKEMLREHFRNNV